MGVVVGTCVKYLSHNMVGGARPYTKHKRRAAFGLVAGLRPTRSSFRPMEVWLKRSGRSSRIPRTKPGVDWTKTSPPTKAHNWAQKCREAKVNPFDLVLHGSKNIFLKSFFPLPPRNLNLRGGGIFWKCPLT
jgi:hypothetical protein